ncbi:MAG: MerR family transcriptional regulator [Thermodesulfobacteriota bacterium]
MMSAIHAGRGKRQSGKKRRLKMKDLSEATGVNGATIRYYINEGLLPKPYKPFRNMAYYDESFIDKIKFIKTLQKDYFLPLEVIRVSIKESGYDLQAVVNKLDRAKQMMWLSDPESDQNSLEAVTREKLAQITGMAAEDLGEAIHNGMVLADEDGLFHEKEILIARKIARIREFLTDARGFSFDLMVEHYKMFEALVDMEFEVFLKNVINNKITVEEANEMAEILLEELKDLYPLIHRRRLSKKVRESLVIK